MFLIKRDLPGHGLRNKEQGKHHKRPEHAPLPIKVWKGDNGESRKYKKTPMIKGRVKGIPVYHMVQFN